MDSYKHLCNYVDFSINSVVLAFRFLKPVEDEEFIVSLYHMWVYVMAKVV